jgi:hypothetical protein
LINILRGDKMKRYLALLLCIILISMSFSACSADSKCFFKAEITEVGESWVMLCPLSQYPESNSSDKISLSGWIGEDDVEVGDIVGIYYGGQVMESYPAQLGGVSKIEIYDLDGNVETTLTERKN